MSLKTFASSLGGKLLLGLALGLLASSLFFLILLVGIYRGQLTHERGLVSAQVNRLLEVSLKNAMLKRDIPGLADIVDKLGRQPGITGVMIVEPGLQVRFASDKTRIGATLSAHDLGCQPACSADLHDLESSTRPMRLPQGGEVLRSVNPIRNQAECQTCHGSMSDHPVNGVLIVDQSAAGVEHEAMRLGGLMAGAGTAIVATALLGAWMFMRRTVVAPVAQLERTASAVAGGDLGARVAVAQSRADEIGALSTAFNRMAETLQHNVGEIQAKETFLQAVVDAVPDGLRVIDADYRVVIANKAHRDQVGDTTGRVVGQPCYKARGRDTPCPPTLVTCPLHAIDEATPRLRYMHELHRADGAIRHVEITASRLHGESNGRPQTLTIEVMRDLDEQIKLSHENRLSEIGQLATGVAHEIYNPLSSVRLGLQALDKRLRGNRPTSAAAPDAEVAEYLDTVNGQIDRCIEITKRLLDLGNPPSSNVQLVSFTRIVPEVLSLLRFEAEIKGVTVDVDLGDDDLRVLATDSELRMLVLNLTQNAFHAMPEGGRLSITGRVMENRVSLAIRDSGVGINDADIKRIFDPFFSRRADGSQGSGLGLTLCHSIVTRYQGSLVATSAPGQGACFTITLPVAGTARSEPARPEMTRDLMTRDQRPSEPRT